MDTLRLPSLPRCIFVAGILVSLISASRAWEPTFERDVLPILTSQCLACHGGVTQKNGLDMRTHAALMQGGKSGMRSWLTAMTPLVVSLLGSAEIIAGSSSPFSKEAQGDWYVLAAHRENKNIAADKWVGSRVGITAEGIIWLDPQKADAPLVSAKCARAGAGPDSKKPADPNELNSTVSGSLCPKQDAKLAARWRITDNDILLLLVEVAEYKGNRNGTYSGAAPADVLLICQRKPVPAASKPDPAADAKRFFGTWDVLGELDDANGARTRPQGNVEFKANEFFKRQSLNAKIKPGQEGTWKLLPPQGTRGRIDFDFKYGIELNQGRSPSLYTFFGDDLLMIVYPEGGWAKDAVENQERRQSPTHFGSDGSRNMWILRRISVTSK